MIEQEIELGWPAQMFDDAVHALLKGIVSTSRYQPAQCWLQDRLIPGEQVRLFEYEGDYLV
ncbi:hypothetical protein ACVWXL_008126 [Bradyrhizobium sp. GM22.5]